MRFDLLSIQTYECEIQTTIFSSSSSDQLFNTPTFQIRTMSVSESAVLIGEIFKEQENGISFFDLVLTRFQHFDQSDRGEETFSDDMNYILQSSMTSLTLANFENRIDSYFYIHHRLEEYLISRQKSAEDGESFISSFELFRKRLYDCLSSIFASSKGIKPNFCSNDSNLFKRVDIPQHLSSITILDTNTLDLFFALCKLSIQSSSDRLHWIGILSKIQDIQITLQDFIDRYINYESAFRQYPIDISTFIHLIQRLHPPKQASISPLMMIISLLRKLNLPTQEFFHAFQPIFIKSLQENRYETKQISDFLRLFRKNEDLFERHLSIYSLNVNTDDLWHMSLHLCTISDINDIIKRNLIKILPKRICSASMETFRVYTQSLRECLTTIEQDSRVHLLEIFEWIYDAFVSTQIQDPRYSSRLTLTDRKELLSIGLELTSIDQMKKPSRLILLRESLFKLDNRMKNTAERMKYLFENFQNLNIDLDPTEILEDDWLKDYLIMNVQNWLKIDYQTYQYLSNHHQNNRWILHIWTRIMHLSLSELATDNSMEILIKLNEWMRNIKRETYDAQDVLTTIFVQHFFPLIMIKYTKSILALRNMEIIMLWIFSMRENQPERIDTYEVDALIRNGNDLLQEILELKGRSFRI